MPLGTTKDGQSQRVLGIVVSLEDAFLYVGLPTGDVSKDGGGPDREDFTRWRTSLGAGSGFWDGPKRCSERK